MALTLTEEFRMAVGGRAFRYYVMTHDETTSTINAASLDLEYIEHVLQGGTYYASDVASTANWVILSITSDHKSIDLNLPAKAGSLTRFLAIGW